jgi:hypothetical protein
VSDPQQVWELCRFPEPPPNPSTVEERLKEVDAKFFQDKFYDYLFGSGHPNCPELRDSGIIPVTDTDIEQLQDNRSLRARMFLKAVTDSDLLPMERFFSINVRYFNCVLLFTSRATVANYVHAPVSMAYKPSYCI